MSTFFIGSLIDLFTLLLLTLNSMFGSHQINNLSINILDIQKSHKRHSANILIFFLPKVSILQYFFNKFNTYNLYINTHIP